MEEKMNGMIEKITTSNGKTIEVDPKFIMESVDDVTNMLTGQVTIIKSVKSIIKRGIAKGMKPSEASQVALEFQKRVSAKANSLVDFEDEEETQLKKDIQKIRNIPFTKKEEAEEAIKDISELLEKQGFVSAAYIYAFAGKKLSIEDKLVAMNYGWKDLSKVALVEKDGSYILEMPEPIQLNAEKGEGSKDCEDCEDSKAATDEE